MRDLAAIALLQDPARRSLYEYVVSTGREVGRNEAAQAVGVQRTLAAFHLDRLAEAGLLDVARRRLTGRSGPGAGRPAKVYSRAATERTVSVPPREYSRAAFVLADAIERSGAETTVYAIAREQGALRGRQVGNADLADELKELGYAPYIEQTAIRLRNCPFDALARESPVVACGMNLAWLEGLLEGAGIDDRQARMDPRPGECCVIIHSKTNSD